MSVFGAAVKRVKAEIAESVVVDITPSDLLFIGELKKYEDDIMVLAKSAAASARHLSKNVVLDGVSFDFHIDKPGERLSYTVEFDEEGLPDGLDVFRTHDSKGETREYVIGL